MKPKHLLIAAPLAATTGFAGDLRLTIEIPQLHVSEYHRPYVAAWIERADRSHAADLSVWYDVGMKNGEGATWLKDLRQWWRKSGRSLNLPVDGVSGPTKPVGKHTLTIPLERVALPPKNSGGYVLVVEAAREVGGREMITIPFKWDGTTPVNATAAGKTELGGIELSISTESEHQTS
jgi:hypothetical protein